METIGIQGNLKKLRSTPESDLASAAGAGDEIGAVG